MKKKILLCLGSSLLSLMLGEMACRAYLFGWDSLWPPVMDSIHNLGVSGLVRVSEHPEIVYELKPNLDTLFKKARFVTNAQGLRDRSYSLERSAGAFRVAVLGDSFTMPAGVPIEQAYHTLLEEELGREFPGRRIEFINFGVGGYHPRQYSATLRYRALAYCPDLVLLGFCVVNDFERYDSFASGRAVYAEKEVEHPFLRLHLASWIASSLRSHPGESPAPELTRTQRDHLDATFEEMDLIVRPRGVGVLVAALGIHPLDRARSGFLEQMTRKRARSTACRRSPSRSGRSGVRADPASSARRRRTRRPPGARRRA